MKKINFGQSTIEYLIIAVIILTVLISGRFIESMRGAFDGYFVKASGNIVSSQ